MMHHNKTLVSLCVLSALVVNFFTTKSPSSLRNITLYESKNEETDANEKLYKKIL